MDKIYVQGVECGVVQDACGDATVNVGMQKKFPIQ
jgi:hypothetical protein